MKIILLLCLTSMSWMSMAQVKNKPVVQTLKSENAVPNFGLRKAPQKIKDTDIKGQYIIERYSIQIKTKETKQALKAVGTEIIISDTLIIGQDINSIDYQINETVTMNTEDYLYRVFGIVPEDIPTDLPRELIVHKTNNLECYGIAELPDGILLIPYNGVLFYLREI